MAVRTLFSRHISKGSLDPEELNALLCDIALFNQIKHTATAMQEIQNTSAREATGVPDRRKKENRTKEHPVSAHVQLKKKYHADDHFVNNAIIEAKGALQSAKELKKQNISEWQEQLKDNKNKIRSTKQQLTRMQNLRKKLKSWSKKKDPAYELSGVKERYDKETGCFEVMNLRTYKAMQSYENAYLFEVQYVIPCIHELKNRLAHLEQRKELLKDRIARENEPASVCYGGKKLFRQQNNGKYPNHATWKRAWQKKRSHALMITGRKDASQGNFRFSYNIETRGLIYRSQQMKNEEPVLVHLKNVVFPYKQEFVNQAVGLPAHERHAVSWRIIETSGSFLIQCIVTVPEKRMVEFIGDGCIGMDTNYDNLSISETDGSGNILRHKVIRFDLEGASSGHAEQIISSALDEAYCWCRKSAKPLVMECLKLKHTANRYGSKKKNFVTSRFAYSTVTALAESKSYKYGIALKKVHPAYTSQAGKLIFMKRYGMSIHEGASAAIARRGMGIQEKVPLLIKVIDPSINWNQPRRQQWSAAYKITKQLRASEMYALAI